VAARVGWTHGHQAGNADAAWSAAGRIIGTVKDLLGDHTVRQAVIDGTPATEWLARLDMTASEDSERNRSPRSSAAQAFAPLREVHARPASAAPTPTDRHQPHQHQGRRR
jgi:hypothetical protein